MKDEVRDPRFYEFHIERQGKPSSNGTTILIVTPSEKSPTPAILMHTLILSDLHLGARNCRTDLLQEVLAGPFERLVLNGDTVDRPDPNRLGQEDWRVIRQLRSVARQRELVVVRGNHDALPGPGNDRGETDFLTELLDTPVFEEWEFELEGGRYLVVHGDQFDRTMNLTVLGDVADWFYRGIQRMSRALAHWVKGASKHLCGVVDSVQQGALAMARERGLAGIVTGHTHFHHDEHIQEIHFLNTGCWVDSPCTAVLIGPGHAEVAAWNGRMGWSPLARVPARAFNPSMVEV